MHWSVHGKRLPTLQPCGESHSLVNGPLGVELGGDDLADGLVPRGGSADGLDRAVEVELGLPADERLLGGVMAAAALTFVGVWALGMGPREALLRAVGPEGHVYSYEIRDDHLAFAKDNVADYFGGEPEWWTPRLGDFGEVTADDLDGQVDRVILDMVEPWHFIDTVKNVLIPGGVFMTYVATVPQLMNIMEAIREAKCFTEPRAWETLLREWKVEGLATRPEHRMNAHTAFLVWTRRLADGVTPPRPQRRARR